MNRATPAAAGFKEAIDSKLLAPVQRNLFTGEREPIHIDVDHAIPEDETEIDGGISLVKTEDSAQLILSGFEQKGHQQGLLHGEQPRLQPSARWRRATSISSVCMLLFTVYLLSSSRGRRYFRLARSTPEAAFRSFPEPRLSGGLVALEQPCVLPSGRNFARRIRFGDPASPPAG